MGKLSLPSWKAKHLIPTVKSPDTSQVTEKHNATKVDLAEYVEHIENGTEIQLDEQPASTQDNQAPSVEKDDEQNDAPKPLPFQSKRIPDDQLPFIPPSEVKKRDGKINENGRQNRLWIVANSTILDVTDYHLKHPGGRAIILGFGGKDCTWQWFSFHNMEIWRNVATGLRVGRTEGVANPFQRPKTIVGLRGHGFQDWD